MRRRLFPLLFLASIGPTLTPPLAAGDGGATAVPAPAPVLREHRYRMSAAIRPFFFWIGSGNVGAARILWRQGEGGQRGYDFLLGSDPRRAPRRINRWGWEKEDLFEGVALQMGLMRKTDEESVDEAKARLSVEGRDGGFTFKAIRTRVANGEARAENTVWRVPNDYGYRDLAELVRIVDGPPQAPPNVRTARLPPGTRPGFLIALADLVDEGVAAAAESPRRLLTERSVPFTFNASLYDLHLRATEWVESATYGARRYDRLVRMDLESYNRELKTRERFTLACATDGPLRGVPVYVRYQPKWWFKAEGVIDESETF